jgi:hypothetical protein
MFLATLTGVSFVNLASACALLHWKSGTGALPFFYKCHVVFRCLDVINRKQKNEDDTTKVDLATLTSTVCPGYALAMATARMEVRTCRMLLGAVSLQTRKESVLLINKQRKE